MTHVDVALFSLDCGADYARRVAKHLGVDPGAHEERGFEDGEHKIRPLVNVRGRDVFVVQSLHGDDTLGVNDKLVRLLIFLGALKDASAARVTAVVPYLAYARKDQKSKPRDPVSTRYVAAMFEAVGTDRVVTVDVHNRAAFQNAFRCRTDHLEARALFGSFFAEGLAGAKVVVVSPDPGGLKRAEDLRQDLDRRMGGDVSLAFLEKYRSEGVVSGGGLAGDVAGRVAIIYDDMIASGTTMARAAKACRDGGASAVYAAATHGLFVGDANAVFADPAIDSLTITDTVPAFRLTDETARAKLTVIGTAEYVADAIGRIHVGGSLVDLTEGAGRPG